MNNKQYPTRMHELLGVEPHEPFEVKGHDGKFILDSSGAVRFGKHFEYSAYSEFVAQIINHPECIIRKPRLSEEQIKELKALLVFNKRWLIKEKDPLEVVTAFSEKPSREDEGWWSDDIEHDFVMTLPLKAAVNSLVSSSDNAPLDIVATLRDAGVTLTDPNQP